MSESLADALSNASAGAIALAWHRREESTYNTDDELEDYVGSLDSIAKIQRWFNASQLGLTSKLTLMESEVSCRLHSDDMWNHLVQLHPHWVHAEHLQWRGLAVGLVRYADDVRCLQRFDTLRANADSLELAGSEAPWTWEDAAAHANRLASMQYLWDKGVRPLDSWIVNWYQSRTSDRIKNPAVLAKWTAWNDWMAGTVLPAACQFPEYTKLYRYVAKSTRLSMNWARVPRLERLLPHLPAIHLAAAWHNDPCWLSVRLRDNPAWCDYAALYRLLHPESFYHFAPDLTDAALEAPLQDVWNIAHALHWTWPQLLDEVGRTGQNEGSLELPVDFAE